ncbi:hypothetical protein EDL98_05370 [Ornithobacterium rhinotracheale]|uniref:hypothetical protein n=1 Tax=Ornithobacterium rhinotracheale TaxID=28251 RepID=UPI00129CE9F2|nr:hypothetical protein [Ornithobacterium rhinotracheale]MRJ10510.1 hypothetical protein [Ornithobacterium rhinotracheale]
MSKYISEQQMLQNFGILFENLTPTSQIAQIMAEYGYDTETIKKGKQLYDKALNLYQENQREGQEETIAYAEFKKKIDALLAVYSTHRKKARLIYKEQPETLAVLRLKGRVPYALASMLDNISVFYQTLKDKENLRTPLKRVKIEEDQLDEQLKALAETQKAYALYTQEKGENQQATKDKNNALQEIDKWVREFFSYAKIALEDKPQLLESLTKFVRS